MYLQRFYDKGLAQASYLVGCQATGEAIVVDPARYTEPYHEAAKANGLRIVAVTETHIHADFVSGSRQLAQESGAVMYLSGEGGPDWSYQFAGTQDKIVHDGDIIRIGNLTLKVLHTPGHTPEHISFLLTDHPASEQPMGVFTGDFLFVGDVGRPDLLERAAGFKDTMREGAKSLFRSLNQFAKLPDHLQIWPAHGAGSACGKALGAVPSSVLGFEKLSNWALQVRSEEEFVEMILEGQPEPPKYFAQMKKINRMGPAVLDGKEAPLGDAATLRNLLIEEVLIVDLRGAEAFAQEHLEGALFLPSGDSLANWAGWLLSYQKPFALLLSDRQSAARALRSLSSIGLDNVSAVFLPATLKEAGLTMRKSQRVEATEIDYQSEFVLDVRSQAEFDEGHLPNAHHIHLGYLTDRLGEIPEFPVVHCKSGMRSLIASSLLERAGKSPRDILGGYQAIRACSLATA
jgi:hydroxyacylglutathione hydrolase